MRALPWASSLLPRGIHDVVSSMYKVIIHFGAYLDTEDAPYRSVSGCFSLAKYVVNGIEIPSYELNLR
jgi:hypothetical protein